MQNGPICGNLKRGDRFSKRTALGKEALVIDATQEDRSLLLSKLTIPKPYARSVPRPQLIERLNAGLERKASFVVAPAGYGKTTLASEWARQADIAVGWLSLDEKDNDLNRFWSYFAAAIEQAAGSLSDSLRIAASTLSPGRHEPFLVALLNEWSGLREPVAIVLDDWHVVESADVIESVSYLLEYLPGGAHLCFLSRKDAGFTKARWVSREWIQELGDRQLRFDSREAEEFFRLCAELELEREQLERILFQTEGWVTGLKLVSLSLREGGHEVRLSRVRSGGVQVEQYLLEEVYESLDEPLRQFLKSVSVLRRMNGPLCEAVAGEGGAKRLDEAARLNLFLVPLEEDRIWYRLHHLFGEFLQKRLAAGGPGEKNALYRKAAAWCESHGLREEAVDYYMAGDCHEEALRLLEEMRSVLIRGEFSTLRAWLSAIPEPLLLRHPFLYFSYIYSLLWANDPDPAERHLQLAERHYEEAAEGWSPEERDRYLGYLYYVRNFKATQHDMDMGKGLEYIRLSLQHSPGGTDLIFASPQMPLTPSIYRSYNGKRGKHLPRGLADAFFRSMIEFMKQMGLHDSVLVCYGELLYERGELEEAEHYLKLGLQGQSQAHYQPEKVYVPAYLFLSRIAMARNDPPQARKWLEEAAERAEEDGAEAAFILIEAEKAGQRLRTGDSSAAAEWRERYRLSPEDPVSVYQLFHYIFLVRTLMETGGLGQAQRLSEKLYPIAVKGHRPMEALDLQILQAVMLQRTGKPEQALLRLEEALKYAQPDDYTRIFIDKGRPVAELLAAYVHQRQKGNIRDKQAPPLAYVRRILSGFGGETDAPRRPSAALRTVLTPREYEVFRLMEQGLDNGEIAQTLGIGMGTLKAHINHIYGKLHATSRVEAIRQGKGMQE